MGWNVGKEWATGRLRRISPRADKYLPADPRNEGTMTDRVWRERGLRDAVAGGDDAAWRAWYEAEYAPLEAYVLWRCGSLRDLADDVLQDTWLTAVRRVRRFDPAAGSFHGWLCG